VNPITSLPAQMPQPSGQVAAQPRVVMAQPKVDLPKPKAPATEMIVDAAGKAAETAAKANADVNLQQFAAQSREVMQAAAQQIQGFLQEAGRNLNVTVDDVTGYYVAKVVNPETGEVIRTMPSEEMLRIARNVHQMSGILVDQRA